MTSAQTYPYRINISGYIMAIAFHMLVTGCERTADETMSEIEPLEPGAQPVSVPSDPRATYHLLRVERMANGNYEAVTRRDGPSGTSYARREIDCTGGRSFRYLGEGDTLADAERDAHSESGELSELVHGSISSEIVDHVCRLAQP